MSCFLTYLVLVVCIFSIQIHYYILGGGATAFLVSRRLGIPDDTCYVPKSYKAPECRCEIVSCETETVEYPEDTHHQLEKHTTSLLPRQLYKDEDVCLIYLNRTKGCQLPYLPQQRRRLRRLGMSNNSYY